jgi:hypothetical protein
VNSWGGLCFNPVWQEPIERGSGSSISAALNTVKKDGKRHSKDKQVANCERTILPCVGKIPVCRKELIRYGAVWEYLLSLRSYWLFPLHRVFRLTMRDVTLLNTHIATPRLRRDAQTHPVSKGRLSDRHAISSRKCRDLSMT